MASKTALLIFCYLVAVATVFAVPLRVTDFIGLENMASGITHTGYELIFSCRMWMSVFLKKMDRELLLQLELD